MDDSHFLTWMLGFFVGFLVCYVLFVPSLPDDE